MKGVAIILIIILFYKSDLDHIFYNRKRDKKIKFLYEMFDNLTIYREKYKTGFQRRYFKNGYIYSGYFSHGYYDTRDNNNSSSIYYKIVPKELYYNYDFSDIIANITDDYALALSINYNRIFVLYYGIFKDGYFKKGMYIDSNKGAVYYGEWKNNKINGEGYIYFRINCYIHGLFKENELIKRNKCFCPEKPESFCDSKLYFTFDVEDYLINENIDWEETLKNNKIKKCSFFQEIIVPFIWIIYILFIEEFVIKIIFNNSINIKYKCIYFWRKIHNIFFKKKDLKSEGYITIINEAYNPNKKPIALKKDTQSNIKVENCLYKIKYKLIGTAFLIKLRLDKIKVEMICLMTNYHVLENIDKDLEEKNKIELILTDNEEKRKINLVIDKKTNIFFNFHEAKIQDPEPYFDYFCIEIDENRKDIIKDYFEVDDKLSTILGIEDAKKEYEPISLSGFPENSSIIMKSPSGVIKGMKKNMIFYNNTTLQGNSGSPVYNDNSKLIAIHVGNEKDHNFGLFFNTIVDDIEQKYIKLIIQNQPIFSKGIGYFCQLKSINDCIFLLAEYNVYQNFILNKKELEFTIGNQKTSINLDKRYEIHSKQFNFCMVELLKNDNINYFFNFLEIDKEIKKKLKENQKYNNNRQFINKKDFFKSIQNYGYNIEESFHGLKNYSNQNLEDAFLEAQTQINKFMEYAIKNLYNIIQNKKYYPRIFNLKLYIRLLLYIILFLPYLSNVIKIIINLNHFKIDNLIIEEKSKDNRIYANFEIIKDNNYYNILTIKAGTFNYINLTDLEKERIDIILIEKGSKIVGDCSFLFADFTSCKHIEIENLDTENALFMSSMFSGDIKLRFLNFTNFNTVNTLSMDGMFQDCQRLRELDLSIFNTINVTTMEGMFLHCDNLISLKISSFDTRNVNSTSLMFKFCGSLKYIDISNFNTSNIIDMSEMFRGCKSLEKIDISKFDTRKVIYMDGLFQGCESIVELNLLNFNTSNVKLMENMFRLCESLKNLDLKNFDTSNVVNMEHMFSGMKSLKKLDLSNFKTLNVEDMKFMFKSCNKLEDINLSGFDTSNVKNMTFMFSDCWSLKSLDLSTFNTPKVLNMKYMFNNCQKIKELKIFNFNTTNTKNMCGMFWGCSSLKNLNIKNFDTSNVETFNEMFYGLYYLTSLDLSNFKTEKVKDMRNMFQYCYSLKTLDISNFVFRRANITGMFQYTSPSLKLLIKNEYIKDEYKKSEKYKSSILPWRRN